jgi:ribosomal protein S4E
MFFANQVADQSVHAQIHVEQSALIDVAITHDRAAHFLAGCALVDTVVMRVPDAEVVDDLVGDHDDVPVAQVRHLHRIGKITEQESADAEGEVTACVGDERHTAVVQIAPAAE